MQKQVKREIPVQYKYPFKCEDKQNNKEKRKMPIQRLILVQQKYKYNTDKNTSTAANTRKRQMRKHTQ